MASPLANLTPGQRQALLVGAPVVAVFALSSVLGRKGEPDTEGAAGAAGAPGAPGMTVPTFAPSTDAIGIGQLAGFESLVTDRLNTLTVKVEEAGLREPEIIYVPQLAPPPPPPPPPAESYPAPPPPVAPCQPPPPGWPGLPGEVVVGKLDAPNGGCWWLSNYAGIAATGGAPFLGSAINAGFYPGDVRRAVAISPHQGGYVITSNRGETYHFPAR